jgi:hypothetical protein
LPLPFTVRIPLPLALVGPVPLPFASGTRAAIPATSRGGIALLVRGAFAVAVIPTTMAITMIHKPVIHLVRMVALIGVLTKAFSKTKVGAPAAAAVSKAAARSIRVCCGPSLPLELHLHC